MNELIHEINNDKDFYASPVLSETPVPKEEFMDSHRMGDDIKYCQQCGAKSGIEDKFCTSCGAKFEVEMKCSRCGASVDEGDMFCTNCGNKL